MVTYYNKKDMTEFGKFLLSKERENRIRESMIENPKAFPDDECLREVYNADFESWIASKRKN